jgi:hypothetical protein
VAALKRRSVGRLANWDAAVYGRRDVVQWLHERGAQYGSTTMCSVASYGHTELCQWLREQGCEWDSTACELAAGHGEVVTLRP